MKCLRGEWNPSRTTKNNSQEVAVAIIRWVGGVVTLICPKFHLQALWGGVSGAPCWTDVFVGCLQNRWWRGYRHFLEDLKSTWEIPENRSRQDDNKNKICAFEGVGALGAEKKIVQKRCFSWQTPRQWNFESANLIVEKFCCHCAGS